MMDEIVDISKKNGIEKINGKYLKTQKNAMVKDLFGEFGFKKVAENENGDSEWELTGLSEYENKCKCIGLA